MVSVIMAGGSGERFWPRSRRSKPKQLLDLTGNGVMIALTADRLAGLSEPDEIIVVTVAGQADAVAEALPSIPRDNIIAEPVGRNTAASVGLAAAIVEQRFGDEPFLVLPADHLVTDTAGFQRAMRAAHDFARRHDVLLTFGVTPTRPETGYGYVKSGRLLETVGGQEALAVDRFCEKPEAEEARRFVEAGTYFWNSGMFCWRPGVVRRAVDTHLPELGQVLDIIRGRMGTEPIQAVLKDVYDRAPRVSVDYGIMEKADNVAMLKSDFGWSDVGNWESIRELHPTDADGNVLVGNHIAINCSNTTVFAPERTVAMVGAKDIVVVDSDDAILICHRDSAQEVRTVVEALKAKKRDDLL